MPLRDHFNPPFSKMIGWRQFHGQWPGEIVRQLNKVLPPQYRAGPTVHLGREAEVDIGTFESQQRVATYRSEGENGGSAVAVWSAEPTLAVETDLADFDEFEVRVYDTSDEQRLVAAIELISPTESRGPPFTPQPVHREMCGALAPGSFACACGCSDSAECQSIC